ncbi:hypothetical protein H0B56_12110 [Haloechinothrix sp. YIM 98757]|uniref:Phage gp6-like head-tail connector protein n=1 Tax=Haloechinothrix aidingensis TaxID=2752311 RepID=A0A838AAP3_9PSEU|nr:hypothetical protein [Haloechinothrix aidingensis]MBA0126286.1 hypothetical protein [Haloechinothrix aidingensis]
MAFASAEDLRLWMRHPAFTTDQTETAELLLDLATGRIEDEARQPLEESTDTVTLDGSGTARLLVPRWPVSDVATVTLLEDGTTLTEGLTEDYTWSSAGILIRRGARAWPAHEAAVEVTYTAGYDPIPMALKHIALRLADSVWDNPDGKTQEQIGDWMRQWSQNVAAAQLDASELRTISAYGARP